jgi:thymidylate synthase
MRSNDVVWGVPYDLFFFTMLQEYLATCLGVRVGEYIHFASSMHLYERHFSLAERILSTESVECAPMDPMTDPEALPQFVECERLLRAGLDGQSCVNLLGSPYWRDLLSPLISYQRSTLNQSKVSADRHRSRLANDVAI